MRSPSSRQWAIAQPWHTNVALLVIGAGMLILARQLVSEYGHYAIGFSGVSSWSVALYALAALLILTQPVDRYTFPIILGAAVVCRLAVLLPAPYLSTDVYRYVWDGVVQHAHVSPYRYVPGDAALSFLRSPNQNIFDHINRRDYAHTIYPPVAQMIFFVTTMIHASVTCMKTVMVLFEGVTMWALVVLLREIGMRREQALLYAWCPLMIWEFAGSGHLDSAAMAFIGLALVARFRKQAVATGIFLGIAVMIKFYPLVLLPALFRRGEYRMPAALSAIVIFGYACYASVGMRVFGFLGGYVKEEGMDSGTRYFLLELAQRVPGLHALPPLAFVVFSGLIFAALTLWCWMTCCRVHGGEESPATLRLFGLPAEADFLVQASALGFALMLLFSAHYPWYVAWLVPLLALLPSLTMFTYICGLFYLCTTALAVGYGPSQFLLNKMLYGSVLLAFCVEAALRRWPLYKDIFQRFRFDAQHVAIDRSQRQT